jgi:hypothetical protein
MNWINKSNTTFSTPGAPAEVVHEKEENDDDNDIVAPLTLTPNEPQQILLYPPALKLLITLDGRKYNYLPEKLIIE